MALLNFPRLVTKSPTHWLLDFVVRGREGVGTSWVMMISIENNQKNEGTNRFLYTRDLEGKTEFNKGFRG